MNVTQIGLYERQIRRLIGCSAEDTVKIKHIMRDDVLHTVALDWISRAGFEKAAHAASELLEVNRVVYEEYFATIRTVFKQMKSIGATEV